MRISFYTGNIKNTKKGQTIGIEEFFNFVKYEKFKDLYKKISQIQDHEQRQKEKAKILPYVTISGVFSERKNSGLLEHSGLIAIDIDGIDDVEQWRSALAEDEYTFAVFKSVSGRGLCVIVKIGTKPEDHVHYFRWLEKYYFDKFNLTIDESCKDVSRPRYVSADPDIIIKERSKRAGKLAEKKTRAKSVGWVATNSQMDRIVGEIVSKGINIAESYDDYLTCAFAIAQGYGEEGRQYFHAVCSISDKYDEQQADKKFDNALRTRSKITIGSFFYLCKQAGISLRTKEEEQVFAIARTAKKQASNVESVIQTAEVLGLDTSLAKDIGKAVFEAGDTPLDDNVPVIEELAAFIKMNANFRRNEITRQIEDSNTNRELETPLLNTLYIKAKAVIGDRVTKSDLEAVINSDNTPDFNPFVEFYKANEDLPAKPEVIDQMVETIAYKDHRAKAFVRRWLLSLPAAINGDVVRIVLTLIGGQETGKTEWFRRLLPEELRSYYSESNLMRDKDDELTMSKSLIVLDDEFGGKGKKDYTKFKEMTSKDYFTLREPYGRTVVKLRRLAVLAATSNDPQVIYDNTGNTRILPVEVNAAHDFDAYNSIDKTQLFVELWRAYKRGEDWNLSTEERSLLVELTQEFETVNTEKEYIFEYFERPTNSLQAEFMTATKIKTIIEGRSRHKFTSLTKLGIELRKHFEREKRKIDGASVYGYLVKVKDDVQTLPPENNHQDFENQYVDQDLPF